QKMTYVKTQGRSMDVLKAMDEARTFCCLRMSVFHLCSIRGKSPFPASAPCGITHNFPQVGPSFPRRIPSRSQPSLETRMPGQLLFAACIATVIPGINAPSADAMGGRLQRPGIAIPTGDSTVAAMNTVFASHDKQYAGGHFINAHSVLNFKGGTKTINAL